MKTPRSLWQVLAVLLALHCLPTTAAARTPLPFTVFGFGVGTHAHCVLQDLNDVGLDLILPNDKRLLYDAQLTAEALNALGAPMKGIMKVDFQICTPLCRVHGVFKNGHIYEQTDSVVAAVKSTLDRGSFNGTNPAVAGWHVWDEPKTRADMDDIDAMINLIDTYPASANKIPFVNLLSINGMTPAVVTGIDHLLCMPSSYTDPQTIATIAEKKTAFRCYLEKYLQLFDTTYPAPVLSVDQYPFETSTSPHWDWFAGLSVQRDAAKDFSTPQWRIPTWRVVQISQNTDVDPGTPVTAGTAITMEMVKWQVHTSLAYGIKGIGYWTLVPLPGPGEGGNLWGYGPGVLDKNLNQSDKYTAIDDLNGQLRELGRVLIDLDAITAFHHSNNCTGICGDEVVGPSHPFNAIVSNISGDGLAGYLKHKTTGENYLFVANKNWSQTRNVTVTLGTTLAAAATRVERLKKNVHGQAPDWELITMNGNTFVAPLAPGEGDLFRVITPPAAATLILSGGCNENPPMLTWIAPGDDGAVGTASQYDLRRSTAAITEANFQQATCLPLNNCPLPPPQSAGNQESFVDPTAQCGQFYYYALKTKDDDGNWSAISNVVNGQMVCTGPGQGCPESGTAPIVEVAKSPTRLELLAPTPNPATRSATIAYAIPTSASGSSLKLGVFDLAGRQVKTLLTGSAKEGRFTSEWNLTSESGQRVHEGIYFARLIVGQEIFTKTIVVR